MKATIKSASNKLKMQLKQPGLICEGCEITY